MIPPSPAQILAQRPIADRVLSDLHALSDGMSERDEVVTLIARSLAEHDDMSVRASANKMHAALDLVITDMQGIANLTDEPHVLEIVQQVATYAKASISPV